MNNEIIAAIIGAVGTIFASILALFFKIFYDKIYILLHKRDFSGEWNITWEYKKNEIMATNDCLTTIKMKSKNKFVGKGIDNIMGWNYLLEGSIDNMGFLFGTWFELNANYKGSFLLKLNQSLDGAEGQAVSIDNNHQIYSGKVVWKLIKRN